MGQQASRSNDKGDDVKRQVDSDVSNRRAIYQLVDVKTGEGRLIELIKSTRARRQSCSVANTPSSDSSSSGVGRGASSTVRATLSSCSFESKHGPRDGKFIKEEKDLEEHIRGLVEPLLYNQGRGKLVPLSDIWRYRFGFGDDIAGGDKNLDIDEQQQQQHQQEENVTGVGEIYTEISSKECRWVCWKLGERGFVGETALHICFLLSTPSHMILAQKLLELFPMLINDIYTCDEYFGESCLHMAIVNENIKIVKWLLDRGAQVHERCLGSFFLPLDQKESNGVNSRVRRLLEHQQLIRKRRTDKQAQRTNSTGELFQCDDECLRTFDWRSNGLSDNSFATTNYDGYCYWGEFPLSFAASLGLVDCYKLLLAKGADPNKQDSNGNSTLHICVIANKIEMFDLCYANGANLNTLNKQHLSPLTLAAKLERVQMFFHILTIQRQVNWIFCQVCFQQMPLDGLDSINTHDGSHNDDSLLSIVVSGSSNAHLEMLNGLLGELLQVKWQTSIRQKFIVWFQCYISFLLVSLIAYVTRIETMKRDGIEPESILMEYILQARKFSEILLILFVIYYLAVITKRVFEARHQRLHQESESDNIKRWIMEAPELTMFTFTCLLILACIPLRYFQMGEFENVLAAVIMFLLPLKLLFFCRASRSLGSFIVMIYKILVNDVLCFVVFLIIFVAGFSQSFYIIFKTHRYITTDDLPIGTHNQTDELNLNATHDRLLARHSSSTNYDKNYFVNLFDGMISMHMMALNEFSLVVDEFESTAYPLLARALFCIYMILASILLVNMLIAMLGKTYQDISSQPNESLRQWARALLTVERMCSNQSRLKMLDKYSHKSDQMQQRFYNSTWALKSDQMNEINLVKLLRQENEVNNNRRLKRVLDA